MARLFRVWMPQNKLTLTCIRRDSDHANYRRFFLFDDVHEHHLSVGVEKSLGTEDVKVDWHSASLYEIQALRVNSIIGNHMCMALLISGSDMIRMLVAGKKVSMASELRELLLVLSNLDPPVFTSKGSQLDSPLHLPSVPFSECKEDKKSTFIIQELVKHVRRPRAEYERHKCDTKECKELNEYVIERCKALRKDISALQHRPSSSSSLQTPSPGTDITGTL